MTRPIPSSVADHINTKESVQITQRLLHSQITPKQWSVFHAVVSCGSYANAAEMLHISQPAVSYIIMRLEEQIGIPLLKMEGRKAKITEHGMKLLRRSQILLREADELELFIKEMRQTRRQKIKLAVNEQFPANVLFHALRAYQERNQGPQVMLIQGHSEKMEHVMQNRLADIAIDDHVPSGFHGELLMESDLLAVAHPQHSLFALGRTLTQADINEEMQVLCESNRRSYPNSHALTSTRNNVWLLSSHDAVLSALTEGLGYAWLPLHCVRAALASGKLKVLPLEEGVRKSSFYLIQEHAQMDSSDTRQITETLQEMIERQESELN